MLETGKVVVAIAFIDQAFIISYEDGTSSSDLFNEREFGRLCDSLWTGDPVKGLDE